MRWRRRLLRRQRRSVPVLEFEFNDDTIGMILAVGSKLTTGPTKQLFEGALAGFAAARMHREIDQLSKTPEGMEILKEKVLRFKEKQGSR